MTRAFLAFLIFAVLLFVLPGLVPGGEGTLFIVLAILAVLFVPAFRRFAIGLVILAVLAGAAYSAANRKYDEARQQFGAAATRQANAVTNAPAAAASGADAWVRSLVAEDWKPFITGKSLWQSVGISTPPCCIHAGDVQQGHLGDCWLLASLAAVARTNPGAIRSAIQSHGDGTYTVTLYTPQRGGFVARSVRINTEFPEYETTLWQRLTSTESRFGYAQPGDDPEEAWVMLFEKAAAALLGGYEKLDGGGGLDGLQLVTGRTAKSFEPRKLSLAALGAQLTQLQQANYPVTAGTFPLNQIVETGPKPLLVDNEDKATLEPGHMYYFVGYDPGTGLVTVGNQHGRGTTNQVTLQQFQFAFTGVFYTDLVNTQDGCTCP